MAIIDYDKSPAISETQRLKSLKESVQRAFDEVDNRFAETSAENTSQNKMIEKLAADVKSGGGGTVVGNVSWSNITGKPSTFNPSAHTHVVADITDMGSISNQDIDVITNLEIEALINNMA